jgi:hypothetical protein
MKGGADRWLKAAEPHVDHSLRRLRRVEIDRRLESLCPLEDRPEETVVKISPAIAAMDGDAFESMLADRALKLCDRGRRIGDRQRG